MSNDNAAGDEPTNNQTDNPTMSDLEQDVDGSTEAATNETTDRDRFMADLRDVDNVTRVAPIGPESVMVRTERDEALATQGFTGVAERDGWYCASYRGHEGGNVVTFAPIPEEVANENVDREIVKARMDAQPSLYQVGACGPGLTAVRATQEAGREATFTEIMDTFGWYVAQINYAEHGETFVFMPLERDNGTDERVDASRVWDSAMGDIFEGDN